MKVATLSLVASCLFGLNNSLVIQRRTFGPLLQMLLGVNNNNNNASNNSNNIVVDATGAQPGQPGYTPSPPGAQAQAQATTPAPGVAPATAPAQPVEIYNDIASNPQQTVNTGAYNSAAAAAQQAQQQQMYGQAGMGYPYPYPQPYPYPPPPPRGPPPGYCYIGNPDPYCRSCHSESEDPACNPPEAYEEYEEDGDYPPPGRGSYPPPSPYGGGYSGYGRY